MQEFRLRIVHDRRKKLKNGTDRASVEIEIGISGSEKRKWISTGVSLSKSELKCIHPLQIKGANSLPEQKYKEEKIIETYDKIRAFTNSPYCHCLDDVSKWNKNSFIDRNFIEFLEEQIEKSDVEEGTKKSYRSLLARLKEFSKIVSFKDLTYRNILEFDKHLRKTINSIKTLQKRHKLMEKTINEAIKMGYLVENPYDKFDMPKGSNYRTPVSLTKEELRLIEEYKPKSQSMSKYKDMFLLQCLRD